MTDRQSTQYMDLGIAFLGSGGWHSTQQRNTNSVLVSRDGDKILIDAGEGTHRQIRRFETGLDIDDIFLTSPEFDHISGVGGVARAIELSDIESPILRIYGPEEAIEKVRSRNGGLDINFEIQFRILDGGDSINRDGYNIQAIDTDTTAQSVGYKISEEPRRGKFDRQKAESLGVEPGPKFQKLTDGKPVETSEGEVVRPDQVLGPKRPGRQIVYTGDTRPCESVLQASRHVDLLIHESTFDESLRERASETGHSTALEAARVADEASAKRLILTGISPRYTGRGYVLKTDAESVYDGDIIVARDGLQLSIGLSDTFSEDVEISAQESTSVTSIRDERQTLREQIENIRELARSGYFYKNKDDIETLVDGLDKLLNDVDNSVLVLGNFHGPYKNELDDIKQELNNLGYDAHTADNLPEDSTMSLEQNISTYMMLSRFSIMIDRDASGHLNEHEIAKRQRNVMARLVPQSTDERSTQMVGGAELIDINHIKGFKFQQRPSECLDDAIEWAEEYTTERLKRYREEYSWRQKSSYQEQS